MLIKTRLHISTLFSVVTVFLIGVAIFVASHKVNEAHEYEEKAHKIVQDVFHLTILTNDYLLHHTKRSQIQRQLKHNSLSRILSKLESQEPEKKNIIKNISEINEDIRSLFSQLKSRRARPGFNISNKVDKQLENRLVNQVLIKSQEMVSYAFQLSRKIHEEMLATQKRNDLLIMILVIILATIIAIASFFIGRSIIKPIDKLREGTEIIGDGNLKYSVGIEAKDEVGQLSQAFDRMVGNLKKVMASRGELEREIMERKKAEEKLRESELWLRNIFNSLEEAVFIVKPDRNLENLNEAAQRMFGYSEEELANLSTEILHVDHEHYLEFWSRINEAFDKGEPAKFEFKMKRKNGERFPSEHTVSLLKDDIGEPIGVVSVVRDITQRRQMQEELLKVKKLESVGILASGIAHDFNNLLTIIIGNIELAKDDIKPEVGISECLAEAEKASIQAQVLTKQLITFSKGGVPVKKIGSIGNLVKETTAYSLSGSNVKCDFLILHDLWPVEFDEGQMKHAIKNMIDNAVESMPDEGTIHVRAENFNIFAEPSLPLLEGKYVKISIRDHGVGIPEKHLSKIFDPYFSTKEMGIQKGMGLGLATTYSIINRHGGYISVESQVGVGTTFTLFLPAHEKDIRELKPTEIHKPEKPEIRTGRILVMDDEESIRKLSKKRLSVLGYESELAKDGAQAIELYKKSMDSGQPFDLVILDLTVKGGMGGKEAIKFLQEINPQVKAIVSSGYSNDPVMTNFRAYGFTGALPKPNTKKELIDVLKIL